MSEKDLISKIYSNPTQDFLDNPYETFEKLRNISSLVKIDDQHWLTTTHHYAKSVLLNPMFGRGDMYKVPPAEEELSPVEVMRKNWMLYNDPPNHTKLKKFSLKVLESYLDNELINKVQDISDYLINSITHKEKFDLVDEYAYPLPLLVIAELLGVPKEDRNLFKHWSCEVNKTLEPCCSIEQKRNGDKIVLELYAYFESLINKSNFPDNCILNKLLYHNIDGESLTHEEIIYTAILILIAGHETTSSMTALGILTLTKFPNIYQNLKTTPDKIPLAVEELLRYEAPVQLARRVALQDTRLFDVSFNKNDMITVCFGAANYDPVVFNSPYDFQINRTNVHMSFGLGPHFCLGSKLARLEGKIVFKDLITKLPMLKRADELIDWKKSIVLRGLNSLQLIQV
ncbi:MAG: cytochrome P450 [Rickettsiaceae bacterium]|nr:cytochrome P450 [Rickettsiaceae bacterium]MCP5378306.1 cytochrome P450 [Rickettsiaceae bacterium]